MWFKKKKNRYSINDILDAAIDIKLPLLFSIKEHGKFDMTTYPSSTIAVNLGNTYFTDVPIKVKWYWSKRVLAWYKNGVIYFNSRNFNRPLCSLVGTLYHEWMHHLGYQHGNNNPKGKENTVPYWVGRKAKEICKQK